MRNQKGFTLIELIIVIVVLGILAVTAAPQFIDFTGDARQSSINGAKGSISGAVNIVYSRAQVDGVADGSDSVTVDGQTINTHDGYPVAADIDKAAGLDFANEWTSANEQVGIYTSGSEADGIVVFTLKSLLDTASTSTDVTNTNCFVRYDDNASDGGKPLVETVTTDC